MRIPPYSHASSFFLPHGVPPRCSIRCAVGSMSHSSQISCTSMFVASVMVSAQSPSLDPLFIPHIDWLYTYPLYLLRIIPHPIAAQSPLVVHANPLHCTLGMFGTQVKLTSYCQASYKVYMCSILPSSDCGVVILVPQARGCLKAASPLGGRIQDTPAVPGALSLTKG